MENQVASWFFRKNDIKKTFGRIAAGLLLFLLLQSVIVSLITWLVELAGFSVLNSSWLLWLSAFVSFCVAALFYKLFLRALPDHDSSSGEKRNLSGLQLLKLILVCFAFMYVANYLTILLKYLYSALSGSELSNPVGEWLSGDMQIFALLYVVIVGPILEELVFRGLLHKKLARFGSRAYIFYSAILFALFHMTFDQLLYAFLLGLVFAYVVHYTGKLIYAIVLHIIVNFFGGGLPIILEMFESDLIYKAWLVFVIAVILCGLLIFFLWLRGQRAEKARKDLEVSAEISADMGEKALFYYDSQTFMSEPPKIKEMLSNAGFIVFALIAVFAMLGISALFSQIDLEGLL